MRPYILLLSVLLAAPGALGSEKVVTPNGFVEIKWSDELSAHVLLFYRHGERAGSYTTDPPARYDSEKSRFVDYKGTENAFLFAVWSSGMRAQFLTVIDLKDFRSIGEYSSFEEISFERQDEYTFQVTVVGRDISELSMLENSDLENINLVKTYEIRLGEPLPSSE